MAQPAPGDLAQALNNHDRVRRSTEIPLYYGRKEKDSISARNLIERITTAAEIAGWNTDARKLQEFYMILRDRALIWWQSLDDTDVNKGNWAEVRDEFLATYEPRFTAKTTCTNFQELTQRGGENVNDYYLRVHEAFSKMCEAKTANFGDIRMNIAANDAAICRQVKNEGIRDTEKFFKHQLFLAGLRDNLRLKTMEAGKANLHESLRYATELEVIHEEKKFKSAVAAVTTVPSNLEEDDLTEEELERLTEEEFAIINAIRMKNGRPLFKKRFGRSQNGKFNGGNSKSVICRYCKKPGHVQKDCFSRKRDNGPMLDSNGKPYERRVNAAETTTTAQSNRVASVETVTDQFRQLNW